VYNISSLICAASSGSPTGVSVAPPCATSTPVTIPSSSVPLKAPSPPVVATAASPPSYPAVLKDRPPSFGKSVPPPSGVPSASGKIPPPVPPRGSPLGKRGDSSTAAPRGGIVRHYHSYHQFHHRTLKLENIRMSAFKQHGSRLHEFQRNDDDIGSSTHYQLHFTDCVHTRSMDADLPCLSTLTSDKSVNTDLLGNYLKS